MAVGTPVITSNLSALPEVAGNAALLVNPYSEEEIAGAMFKLLTDNNMREDLKQKGKERAKKFSWEKNALETLSIYDEVINEKNKGSSS